MTAHRVGAVQGQITVPTPTSGLARLISPRRRHRLAAILVVPALVVAGMVATAGAAAGEVTEPDEPKTPASDTLSAHDADLLAEAQAKGEQTVTLIVATEDGQAASVAGGLQSLGGSVAKQVDEVGYVRVRVPTAQVVAATKLPGVSAVDLDEILPLPDPDPSPRGAAVGARLGLPGPSPATPATNPYMPTAEIGAVRFKTAHPEWDGRGVTIGIMDSGVDLDNPALQTTSTGERKIVDWFTATDPLFDGDATWRAMLTEVAGPTFTFAGATWQAPEGTYRVNRFSEAITAASEIGGDVNRDGDTTDTFGVLYDPETHDIWVDANQDNDFTNDALMRPYAERYDVGHFGTDDPATAVRDQMPFTVEYREDVDVTPAGLEGTADFVNIGIVDDSHGSHVAGITSANDMLGNAVLDGVAPGAKIVSARACLWTGGCSSAALTDGMVELVVNRGVDVVNMSIGGLPALNDGNNARAVLYNRLINDYGVQMFFSAGNEGPGLNSVGDPSVTSDAVSVAASVSSLTWYANYGAVTARPYTMFNFSSRGPSEAGGFKPNLSAPGSAISTVPVWQEGNPVPEAGYDLPPGYAMLNGTSMAAPQATGAAALLLSAAKATDRGITPAALRRALYSSANWIPGVPAAAQGNGLVNVPRAWRLLAQGVVTREYTSTTTAVCTPLSEFLEPANQGSGIYNRCAPGSGGIEAGTRTTATVTVTRTTGPDRAIRHQLRWLGNDGTFSSERAVELPLNQPVDITITIRGSVGAHSAVLRIDDPSSTGVDFEVMNAVVIARAPAGPDYANVFRGWVDRASSRSYFVTVPEGTKSLQLNLSGIATGSQVRFIAFDPNGVAVGDDAVANCYTNSSDPAVCNPQERSYEDPLPGVWEISVQAARLSPALLNPFKVTARLQGVLVEPALVEVPTATVGQAESVTWSLTNQFGPVTVVGQGGPLGSAVVSRPTIADGASQEYEVEVPAGADRLDVAIGNPSDPGADLDLSVYLGDELVAQQADGDSEEAVSIPEPAAGTYTVVVDGYEVPSGTTEYDYRDVFYSPALGSLTVESTPVELGPGGTGEISGEVTALSAPAEGRSLFGEMVLLTDWEEAVVGRGRVVIGSVVEPAG